MHSLRNLWARFESIINAVRVSSASKGRRAGCETVHLQPVRKLSFDRTVALTVEISSWTTALHQEDADTSQSGCSIGWCILKAPEALRRLSADSSDIRQDLGHDTREGGECGFFV